MNEAMTVRPYQCEDDFWRMRAFLRDVFALNGRREIGWHVARLDYARWHSLLNCAGVTLSDVAWIWETGGRMAGFVMPDGGKGEAHFNVDPRLVTPAVEEDMLDLAERELAQQQADGSNDLIVWCPETNTQRQSMLARRGYRLGDWYEHQWRRDLTLPIPDVPLAAGYTLRSVGDGLELLERCYASGLGFHEGDIAVAVNNRNDITWYRNIQTAALYRRDLDLVAVAPDGSTAAFCTIWFDDVTRSAYYEPVATVPAHQRRGLGRAVMTEGLKRLQRMGATLAFVGGFSEGANALYQSVMGGSCERYLPWEKTWRP